MHMKIYFEPRDLWVGIYWTRDGTIMRLYICLLPMLPIRISWWSYS